MKDRRNYVISYFMCTNCGHETIPLPRLANNKKHWGHLKKMYCPFCKQEYNAFEIVNDYDKEVFYQLFESGAFKENCDIMEQDRKQKKKIVKQLEEEKKKKKKKNKLDISV